MVTEVKGGFSVLDGALRSDFTLSAQGVKVLGLPFLDEGDVLKLSEHQPPLEKKFVLLETKKFGAPVVVRRTEVLFSAISRMTR